MKQETFFAPAERSSNDLIKKENELVTSLKLINEIFGVMAGIGALLNDNRQVIYSNKEFLDFLGLESLEPVLGKRPGEIVSCIHSDEMPGGCGTARACAYCGAVNAIRESQLTQRKSVKETSVSSLINGKQVSLDLTVTSTPVVLEGKKYYVFTLRDISSEKKLLSLEKIFFHDLLNSAGGLNGLLTILKMGTDPEEARELINKSEAVSQSIIEEIMLYRQLRAAENGDIEVKIETISSAEFLGSAISRIEFHEVGQNKKILVHESSADIDFQSDRILLQRVLINLLKNSLEATPQGGIVSAGCDTFNDKVHFWVRNKGVMPQEVQMKIFQRSFSTKGKGRGLGTYSIRLMTENYLNGKVSFVSNEDEGTVFNVILNKAFPA